jgi:hypothetical protein
LDKIINEGGDYITNFYPRISRDPRIKGVIDEGIKYIVETNNNNVSLGTWKVGSALVLMQLVKIVAEWELYQSFVAARTIDGMYSDFISNVAFDKIELLNNKIYDLRKKKVEKWIVDYARGRKSLSEFIIDY